VRFPQIIGASVVVTLLSTTLFDKFAPLDSHGLLQAYLDLVFGPLVPKEHPKRTCRSNSCWALRASSRICTPSSM
jgi:hypothetical protein